MRGALTGGKFGPTLGFEDQIWHVARHLGGCEALYHNYIINVDQNLTKM